MSEQEKAFLIDFSKQIGELCADIRNVMSRLEKGDMKMADHEARLSILETCKKQSEPHAPEPLKDWIIKSLIRIIGWGTVIVGSLVGAGDLIKAVSK